MKKREKLAVLGMALYCAVVFCAFLAWGLHSAAAEMPEPVAPVVSAGALEAAGDREGRPYGHAGNADRQSDAERGMLGTVYDDPDMGETDPGTTVHVIDDCVVTYYCCEKRAHICGTGDGITATGAEATPGMTCAVDPAVIPFGSIVCVDYGDGVLHEYVAQDSGAWVNEDHVDLCVETHSEALELGRRTATVYWTAPEN